MVYTLIAAGALAGGSAYMNKRGADKRERALEAVAERERQLANMQAAANEQFSQQDIAQYGELAQQRRAALGGMLDQYLVKPGGLSANTPQIEGDPRFELSAVQGEGSPGTQWANAARSRIGRGLDLQQAVRGHEDLRAMERLQRAQSMGGFQQTGDVLSRQGRDYGDIAALRRQAFDNEMIRHRGDLEMQRMRAGQAGSEQMLYGSLLGLGAQSAGSFGPVGKKA